MISITGPRQSGKTTLIKNCFPDYVYKNLELPDERTFAEEDPRGFLSSFKNGIIIDEAQYVPHLFSYIQSFTDETGLYGRFILSGSQNFLLSKHITQSLAGRVAILNLHPFTLNELNAAGLLPNEYFSLIYRGFYPSIYDRKLHPSDFYPYYIQSYLERDVRNISNISNLMTFKKFLGILAGRTAQILNYSSISNELGVDQKTIKNWISILKARYCCVFAKAIYERGTF